MSTKPSLIKLRSIETLLDTILSGNIYKQAVIPLLHGEVTGVNDYTITVQHLNKTFKLRTDTIIGTDMDKFIELLRSQVGAYGRAGADVFKDLTDINSLELALTTENTFARGGIICTSRKISNVGEDGTPMIMEYRLNSKLVLVNKEVVTRDPDEMFVFLGSLARRYSINMQRPDANWHKDEDEPKKEVKLKSGGNGGRVALVGGPRGMGAALAAAMVAGSATEVATAKE